MKKTLLLILAAMVTGCAASEAPNVESDSEGLHLSCSTSRTEFLVGEKLPPPKVTIHNTSDTDIDLVGPNIAVTATVIRCTLTQPDASKVDMRIAMPTGRSPHDMPKGKVEARTKVDFTPSGVWHYKDGVGYEPYIFPRDGIYEFRCEYEEVISDTITLVVKEKAFGEGAERD